MLSSPKEKNKLNYDDSKDFCFKPDSRHKILLNSAKGFTL